METFREMVALLVAGIGVFGWVVFLPQIKLLFRVKKADSISLLLVWGSFVMQIIVLLHILIQEDAAREGDTVTVTNDQRAPSSIRKAGLDFMTGAELAPAGHVMTPGAIALAAAGNVPDVEVFGRPRVGVLATGDELVAVGASLGSGQIVNSIQPAVLDCVRRWGGLTVDLGVARDTIAAVRERIAGDLDLVVSIGGASVGEYDVVRDSFLEEGFQPVFEKVAVKPGKPRCFSAHPNRLALGLPGNSAASSSKLRSRTIFVPLRTACARPCFR